jgi:hypothetical protein
MRKVYNIEGEMLSFTQIRKRVGDWLSVNTLRKRLDYGWRTWVLLRSPSSHKARPETHAFSPTLEPTPKPYRPAHPGYWGTDQEGHIRVGELP